MDRRMEWVVKVQQGTAAPNNNVYFLLFCTVGFLEKENLHRQASHQGVRYWISVIREPILWISKTQGPIVSSIIL